jgi:two-component system sensor histidine kinase KdpD
MEGSERMMGHSQSTTEKRPEGRLTIYLGSAPGVGKTYKMLQDAHVVRDGGVDVVIGWLETHGREETRAQVGNLEVIPAKTVWFEGHDYSEMDTNAIIRRRPQVALVDELAHSNVPQAGANAKRYQDVMDILDAGIDVVTTVNIQHLESLHDKVAHMTGVHVRERIPDWFVDRARELKLVDVPPETLQERLIQGKIYALSKVEAALSHFFQLSNLSALRELALLEVADDVDQRLDAIRHRPAHGPQDKILVCVNYRPHSEQLIRRGWRMADRLQAQLLVLIVLTNAPGEGLSPDEQRHLERINGLCQEFDARVLTRKAAPTDIGPTIVRVATELEVTQIIMGQPVDQPRWRTWRNSNPVTYVLENAEFMDLLVVSNVRDEVG